MEIIQTTCKISTSTFLFHIIRIFKYSRTNQGFDSTNLWRRMIRRIHDSASNIRIFGFDRIKMPFTANRGQIWIQDTSTHAEMREKAKDDESYRERLLKYISHLVTKTMHKNLLDEAAEPFEERVFGSRAFCPFQQPFGKEFEIQKPVDLYDLVLSRNMHSKSHTPTCFKYGNTKKCQAKFPRTLVEETHMELE